MGEILHRSLHMMNYRRRAWGFHISSLVKQAAPVNTFSELEYARSMAPVMDLSATIEEVFKYLIGQDGITQRRRGPVEVCYS